MNKIIKSDYINVIFLFLLSFLYIVLLDEHYQMALDSLMFLIGIIPVFIGINNSLYYLHFGLGLTRKSISRKYISDLLHILLFGIIYVIVISLFSSLVYKSDILKYFDVVIEAVYVYTVSITIASWIMLFGNLFLNFKNIFSNIVFIVFMLIVFFAFAYISIYIYKLDYFINGVIISFILFIVFSFVNRKIILCKKM